MSGMPWGTVILILIAVIVAAVIANKMQKD